MRVKCKMTGAILESDNKFVIGTWANTERYEPIQEPELPEPIQEPEQIIEEKANAKRKNLPKED